MVDSEQTGTKQASKLKEVVDSDSDKEEKEERAHVIKKIKHEHAEELIGVSKGKEIIELEDETVVPKTPMAGPLHQTLKPVVLISSTPKSVPKPIITPATPVAGPSTAQIVLSLAPKPTAAMPVSVPVKSAGKPAIKGGSVFKDPFMATEVAAGKVATATQETMRSEKDTGNKNNNNKDRNNNEDDNEGGKDNDDDSADDNDAAMDVDSGSLNVKILKMLHPKGTLPMAPTKVTVTEDIALVPVP
ncbi:hypothetical protein C0995_006396, partial [Termitomyces sp. Mi166